MQSEKPFLPESALVHILKENYGFDVVKITFLPLGADMNASVYKAETSDKSYFIKLKRYYNRPLSLAITKLLADAGIEQIIHPIQNFKGELATQVNDYNLIVYPFIEGEDGFKRDLNKDQWIKLGSALRKIHEIKIPTDLHLPNETFSDKWRNELKELLSKGLFNERRELLQKLIERTDELALKVKDLAEPFVLCHSDIHGGNVLIDEKNEIYIVDWDEPILAPKERDLMFIGGGVADVWNKPEEEAYFYQGYGKTEINRTLLAYYRHVRIVEDIVIYYHELQSPNLSAAEKQRISPYYESNFSPNGVLDIAFKTY